MNNFIKNAFVYGLGAATGAFVAIKLLEEHYAAIAEEEIQAVKEDTKRRLEEYKNSEVDCEDVKKEVVDKSSIKNDITTNTYKKLCRDYTKPNLQELSNKYEDLDEHPRDDEEYHTEDEDEELLPPPNLDISREGETGPYLITGEEFANENMHYDKLTLWYYKKDNTLADDREEIVDDVTSLIGDDALGLFNNIGGEKTIHIRNEKISIDFEIICLEKSYKEEILGVIEEE